MADDFEIKLVPTGAGYLFEAVGVHVKPDQFVIKLASSIAQNPVTQAMLEKRVVLKIPHNEIQHVWLIKKQDGEIYHAMPDEEESYPATLVWL